MASKLLPSLMNGDLLKKQKHQTQGKHRQALFEVHVQLSSRACRLILLEGGALGGCAAAILMRDKFVSAAEIISNMSDNQKDELITAVQRALSDIEVMDIVEMLALLCGDIHVKKRIIRAIIDYFHSQMRLEIID